MTPWWSKKYGKDSFCGITHSRLRPGKNSKGEKYCTFLRCGHGFYTSALMEWFSKSIKEPTCPMCRMVV